MKPLKISGTANANLQNKINISGIFNYIREHGPTFRARIARDLGISPPAVSRAIDRLIEDGYIVETSKIVTASGKRPIQLSINAGKGVILGVDLIKERIKIAVSDFSGRVTSTHQGFSFSEDIDACRALVAEIDAVLEGEHEYSKGIGEGRLRAIGVGVPAIVDIDTGAVVDAPLYRNLRGINLKRELEERYRVPVFVENVVKLSAIGEKQYGEGRIYKDIVFIEISDGIGAGIILDDHLVRGYYGSAGEIGFSIIGTENLDYVATYKGFLEQTASYESIGEMAREEWAKGRWPRMTEIIGGNPSGPTPSRVCEEAYSGDPVALRIVGWIAAALSVEIVNLILLLNPQLVVIGGDFCGLPRVEELFIRPIAGSVKRCVPFSTPEIRLSALGENAGVIGASHFAISSLLLKEFPYTVA